MLTRIRSTSTSPDPKAGVAITSLSVATLLFLEILMYGANTTELALGFAGLWFFSVPFFLAQRWGRQAVNGLSLDWIGAAFFGTILAGVMPFSNTRFMHGTQSTALSHFVSSYPIDAYSTLVEIIKLIGLGALFIVGGILGAERSARGLIVLRSLQILGILYGIWALSDRENKLTDVFGQARNFDPGRLSASLISANTAATLFGAIALINFSDLLGSIRYIVGNWGRLNIERIAPRAALPLIGMSVATACQALTLSRGGISSTLIMMAVLVGIYGWLCSRQRAALSPIAAVLTLCVTLTLFMGFASSLPEIEHRLTFLGDDGATRRIIFSEHWKAFAVEPLLGYGLGSFREVNRLISNPANISALGLLGATHNVYLEWLEQSGLIGAGCMFLCIALVSLKIGGGVLRTPANVPWLLGILSSLALFLIHGATDFALEVPAMAALLSLLLGLAYGMVSPLPTTRHQRQTRISRAVKSG